MPIEAIDPESYGEELSVLPKTKKKVAGEALTQNVQAGGFLPMARSRLAGIEEELNRFDSEPVDVSALQAYAKRQGESGGAAMLNALAAQYAGESFQPIQAQLLKRAAAAQEPMKVSGGILTPDGQFVKDPYAARDSRRKALEGEQAKLLGLLQKAEQAQTDAEARKAQQDVMNQMRMMGLSIQQQGLALRGALASQAQQQRSQADADRKDRQLGESTQKLSKQTEDYTNLAAGVRELNNRLNQYVPEGKSIPGIGYGSDIQPLGVDLSGLFIGQEGKTNRAMVKNVANELLRAASGQAVTLNEYERQLLSTMASGRYSEKDFLNAWESVILPKVNETFANIGGGYSPEVKERYRAQGGKIDFNKPFAAPTRGGKFEDPEKERRYQEWKRSQGGQ